MIQIINQNQSIHQSILPMLPQAHQSPLTYNYTPTPDQPFFPITAHLPSFTPQPHSHVDDFFDMQTENQPAIQPQADINSATSLSIQAEKRPRKALTYDLIHRLNEYFLLFQQQPKGHGISLADIAKELQIGYSTILRKHRQFKAFHQVQLGKRLAEHQEIIPRTQLARCLIIHSLKQSKRLQNARQISLYIAQHFGFQYNPPLINRELRRMGFKNIRDFPQALKDRRDLLVQLKSPLERLLLLKKTMIYIGKYRLFLQNKDQIIVMLMVSRFGAALRFLENERKAMRAFQSMLKELSESQRLDLSDVWYLVAGKEDILREEVSQSFKEQPSVGGLRLSIPKTIILTPSQRLSSPAYRLYQQISSRLQENDFSASETISILPEWFSAQQKAICQMIGLIESNLAANGYSRP